MRRVTKVPYSLRVCVTELTISSSKSIAGALHLVDGPLRDDHSRPVDIILQRGGKCVKKSVCFGGPESSASCASASASVSSPFRGGGDGADAAGRGSTSSQEEDGDVTRHRWEGEATLLTELTLANSVGADSSSGGNSSGGDLLGDKSYDLHITASDCLELVSFSIDVSKFVSSSSDFHPPHSLSNRIELSSSTSLPVPSSHRFGLGFGSPSSSAYSYVDEGIVSVHLVAFVTCVARPSSSSSPFSSPTSFFSNHSPKYANSALTPPSVVPPEDAFDGQHSDSDSDGSEGYNSDASSTAVDKSHYDAMTDKVAFLNEQVSLWKSRAAALHDERLQLESAGSAVLSRLSSVVAVPSSSSSSSSPVAPSSSVLGVFAGVDVLLESATRAKSLDAKLVGLRAQGELMHRHRATLEARLDVASSAEKVKIDKMRLMEKAVEDAKERERLEREYKAAIAARHTRLVGEIQKKGAAEIEFEAEKAKHDDWIEQLWSDSDDDGGDGSDDDGDHRHGSKRGKANGHKGGGGGGGFDSAKGIAIARLRTKNKQLKDLIVSLGQAKRNLTHNVVNAEALASRRTEELGSLKQELAKAKENGKKSEADAAAKAEQLRAKEDEIRALTSENAKKEDEVADTMKKLEVGFGDMVKKHGVELAAANKKEQEGIELIAQKDKNAAAKETAWEAKYAALAQVNANAVDELNAEWSNKYDALATNLVEVKMQLVTLLTQQGEDHHKAIMMKRASTIGNLGTIPQAPGSPKNGK